MRKLKLYNFKCFVENQLDFRPFTILTGINAAGKSSIIQALLLYNEAAKKAENTIFDVNGILGIDVGSPKNLVSQNAKELEQADFRISVDEHTIDFLIDKESGLNVYASQIKNAESTQIWYLNAERIGPRMNYRAGGEERMKPDGSNAVYLMERADSMELQIPDELIVDSRSRKFSYQAECWMNLIMGNVKLHTKVEADKAQAELKIKNDFVENPVIPTLTGFGISYELSVVVAGLWLAAVKNGILIVENPEAHLHPSAQSAVGKFLAMIAASGVQVIVETHSEHIVDGARIQMYALGNNDQFLVNYLDHQENEMQIKPLFIEEDGELSEWPEGFFDQKQRDLRELFQLRRENGNHK